MTSGGMFDKEAMKEGVELAERAGLYPVSAGEDIFAAIRSVDEKIDRVLQHDVPQPPESLDTEKQIQAALRSHEFVEVLRDLDRILNVAAGEMHRAKRDDVVKLLVDPLSPETRNTRRNLGVLTVVAVLVGFAGRPPNPFLGLGMDGFPKWAFPMVLGAVIAYECVAFTLYLNADLESRKIHNDSARHDRDSLLVLVSDFEERARKLKDFMAGSDAMELLRGMASADEVANVVPKCLSLAMHWRRDVSEFDREFGVQWRRRWWDEWVPFGLVALAGLFLLSLIPPVRLWLWELFHQ